MLLVDDGGGGFERVAGVDAGLGVGARHRIDAADDDVVGGVGRARRSERAERRRAEKGLPAIDGHEVGLSRG